MKDQKNNWFKYSNIGFQISISIFFFGWIGYKMDQYYNLSPYGLLIGLLLGSIVSLYGVWKDSNKY